MEKNAKIFVAGHRGMVGSAIVRALKAQGYSNLVTRTRDALDLRRQDDVDRFFAEERSEYVFLAAAKVGGIAANAAAPADFLYENMMLEMNVLHAAWRSGCRKLLFLGSSCIYPRLAPQPMPESCLLTSAPEATNEAYALAAAYLHDIRKLPPEEAVVICLVDTFAEDGYFVRLQTLYTLARSSIMQ